MEYRIDKERLLEVIGGWDSYLRKKVRLIACGGTAMTLLGAKVSTKDIDLIALNYYDLIISKLFRGMEVDFEDCLALMKSKDSEIDIERLKARFYETASYDIAEEKINKNLESLLERLRKEG